MSRSGSRDSRDRSSGELFATLDRNEKCLDFTLRSGLARSKWTSLENPTELPFDPDTNRLMRRRLRTSREGCEGRRLFHDRRCWDRRGTLLGRREIAGGRRIPRLRDMIGSFDDGLFREVILADVSENLRFLFLLLELSTRAHLGCATAQDPGSIGPSLSTRGRSGSM